MRGHAIRETDLAAKIFKEKFGHMFGLNMEGRNESLTSIEIFLWSSVSSSTPKVCLLQFQNYYNVIKMFVIYAQKYVLALRLFSVLFHFI